MERASVSIMKASELAGVSRRTIYNWLHAGKVSYLRTAGGSVRIFLDTLWRDDAGEFGRAARPAGVSVSVVASAPPRSPQPSR